MRASYGYSHNDEPDTKKIIIDEPDDNGADLGTLDTTGPGRLPSTPLMMGGNPKPVDVGIASDDTTKVEADKMKAEDDLIISKAILGHSLHEVYSNRRIQLAVSRTHMSNISKHLDGVDMSEVFSPERVTSVCRRFGLEPGEAMDVKNGYDFDCLADRQKCWKYLIEEEPLLVIGSPPCTHSK